MGLKICMLSSGSKGNCTYITDGKTSVLIDLGIACKTLNARAAEANINLKSVSAVINTHCHTDHCKGIRTFIKKHDVPVYSHTEGKVSLCNYAGIERNRVNCFNGSFTIGSLTVTPFIVPHDAPVCCGFSVENAEGKISLATDLGKADDSVLNFFYQSDYVVLESNHDLQMLKNGRYPYSLKKRILSEYGHLSNDDCAAAIKKLIDKGSKKFMLAHLSEENNLPELAFTSLSVFLNDFSIKEGKDYSVTVATQHRPTKLICV